MYKALLTVDRTKLVEFFSFRFANLIDFLVRVRFP